MGGDEVLVEGKTLLVRGGTVVVDCPDVGTAGVVVVVGTDGEDGDDNRRCLATAVRGIER